MSTILEVLGPTIQHLTELSEDREFCLMKGEVPPGVIVPLHSHADHETFFVLSGELEAYSGESWKIVRTGDTVDLPGNMKHAWRNSSNETVKLLIATTVKLGEFFNEIGRPVDSVRPGPPEPAVLQNFIEKSLAYGYWIGTPEDNAVIGIKLG